MVGYFGLGLVCSQTRGFSSVALATMVCKAARRVVCYQEGLYLMAGSKHRNPP